MPKKGRHRKPPQGPRRFVPRQFHVAEPEPDLMREVRRAMAEAHPLGLLSFVSAMLTIAPDDLVASFLDVDSPETSALLTVIAELGADDLERARIRRELEARHPRLPA